MENPHELSERAVILSGSYSRAAIQVGRLKKQRAVKWLEVRKNASTDKEADNLWGASEEGQQEIELTYLMKGLEKEISAIKSHLRVLDTFGHL